MRPKHLMIELVILTLVSLASSLGAAFERDSYVSRPRTTDTANWERESALAARSRQELSGHAPASEAARWSESHPSGNYFQGESSVGRNLDNAGLSSLGSAGDNPHFFYGGQPSPLGDPSVQGLSH
jgi:hypothetical protein